MEILEIYDLNMKDEVDLVEDLKNISSKMIKNRNILINKTLQNNEVFTDYLLAIRDEQEMQIIKFKAIIKNLNEKINRGDF